MKLQLRGYCPHCGEVTRDGDMFRTEDIPHARIQECVQILREKLERVIERLDEHRL